MAGPRRRLRAALDAFPAALARLGVVDREKGTAAFDLATPAMVTGGLRTLLRSADFLFVSVATGGAAVGALELGFQYYFVAFGISLGLTSGTISVVSRFEGADDPVRRDLAVSVSLWLALAVALPLTAVAWLFAPDLIGVLTDDPRTVADGATYLRIVMLGAAPRFWTMIAARALAGAGDTRTPMYVRLLTLPTNLVLNALLVFGLGPFPRLEIAGAAWATTIATSLAAVVFLAVLLSGRWGVRLRPGAPHFDWQIARELVRVGAPLTATRLARTFGRFPFLFVLGVLGPAVLGAYAIGRRVMLLAIMPAWGYSTAASTLVGQAVGGGDGDEAADYGWQTLRIGLATQLLVAVAIVVAARPLADLFATDYPGQVVAFVRVFALGVAGFSVARTMRGALRGAGDTRWPLYGTVLGTYAVRLPLAALALPVGVAVTAGPLALPLGLGTLGPLAVSPGAGLGLLGVYAAIVGDMYVRATVNLARFASGAWRAYGLPSSTETDRI